MATKKLNYNDAMEQLQVLYTQLKEDKIPLENLPEEIRKARGLLQYCQELLRSIEQEIEPKE
ncbi:MAG: exodeoxyribonuclease VII small subunit [Saprospiraceae bacterium]|nr:exodeoxyribonuclease VII small subunit [Saprospiraceae bacterium]MBK7736903.1 exodeoxyribonuclease VII small subunit [Saprospiraceae bacterium]MBK7914503.1 exodeoxyribonuclease VII small subunit [Saprospiraceae bacterium]